MIKALWQNYLRSGLELDAEHPLLPRIMVLNAFSIVGNVSLLVFATYYFIGGNMLNAVVDCFFAALGIVNVLLLRRTGNFKLASTAILVFMILMLLFLFVEGGIADAGFLWFATYPLIAFFMKGLKPGMLWLLVLAGGTLIVMRLQSVGIIGYRTYSGQQILLLFLSLFAVSTLAFFYEMVREHLAGLQKRQESELREKRKVDDQLALAEEVQRTMMPERAVELNNVEISGVVRQAHGIGGDYFDYWVLDDNRVAVIAGDFSGNGIPAALGMANTHTVFRGLIMNRLYQPSQVLGTMNAILARELGNDVFTTLFYYVYESRTRAFVYCGAGDGSALHYSARDNIVNEISSETLPVGVDGSFTGYQDHLLTVAPGDIFTVFTDGVTEAANSSGELFGRERLKQAVIRNRELSTTQLNEAILAELTTFMESEATQDDLALVTARVN